jgi:hypothetical protein
MSADREITDAEAVADEELVTVRRGDLRLYMEPSGFAWGDVTLARTTAGMRLAAIAGIIGDYGHDPLTVPDFVHADIAERAAREGADR